MKRLFFVFTACCLIGLAWPTFLSGQSTGLYLRLGGGINFALNAPKLNPVVDPLIALPRHEAAIGFSLQWQFRKGLGIGIDYRSLRGSNNFISYYTRSLESVFPDSYVTVEPSVGTQQYFGFGSQLLGSVSYRFIKGKWGIMPRLLLGKTDFARNDASIRLKQRDTNKLDLLTLRKEDSHASMTYGLGGVVQYPLGKFWGVFAAADWTYFSTTLNYKQTISHQVDGSIETLSFGKKRPFHLLHFSVGFTMFFNGSDIAETLF